MALSSLTIWLGLLLVACYWNWDKMRVKVGQGRQQNFILFLKKATGAQVLEGTLLFLSIPICFPIQ